MTLGLVARMAGALSPYLTKAVANPNLTTPYITNKSAKSQVFYIVCRLGVAIFLKKSEKKA